MSVRVQDIMSTSLFGIEKGSPLAEAVQQMAAHHISCLPVVQEAKPVGVISERDIVEAMAAHYKGAPLPEKVCDVMTAPATTIHSGATVDQAIGLIHARSIRRLIVVDEVGKISGLITLSDLVSAQALVVREERDRLETRVTERTEELRRAMDRLEHMSLVDPMLGCGNRRAMDIELGRLQEIARQLGSGYSVLIFDIDDFKKFNDHYGHPAGDTVLCDVVAEAQDAVGDFGMVYRYGGEEFLVSVPGADSERAQECGEKIRGAVENLGIEHALSAHAVVTVSIGVASEDKPNSPRQSATLVNQADAALYRAKQAGRNRVSA